LGEREICDFYDQKWKKNVTDLGAEKRD